jgi:hypothetical protein
VIARVFDEDEDDSARQMLRAEKKAILEVQRRCKPDITPSVIGVYYLEGFDAGVMIIEDGGDYLSEEQAFDSLSKSDR